MDAIYPISALQKNTSAVRAEAKRGLVRITENGRGAYVFCSEEVFEDRVARAVEDRLFEQRVIQALDAAFEDIAAGREYPAEESRMRIRAARAARSKDVPVTEPTKEAAYA